MSVKLFADDEYCIEFATTKNKLWLETEILSSFLGKADEFSAILVVGGFGREFLDCPSFVSCYTTVLIIRIAMFDLVDNEVSIKLIQEFYQKNLIVSAVCHGAAALINVNTPEGTRLVAGERVTGFSDQEEIDVDMVKHMPFRLQDALDKSSGGHYEKAEKAWAPHVVVSTTKKLLIGQNPASAKPLAEALLGKLLAVAKD